MTSPLDQFLKMQPLPKLRDVATRRKALDSYVEYFNERAIELAHQLRNGQIGLHIPDMFPCRHQPAAPTVER